MFGLSIGEVIFTAILVVVVWRAFKYWERIKDGSAARPRVQGEARKRPAPGAKPARPPVVELVACPHCGTFHPKGQPCACGRG